MLIQEKQPSRHIFVTTNSWSLMPFDDPWKPSYVHLSAEPPVPPPPPSGSFSADHFASYPSERTGERENCLNSPSICFHRDLSFLSCLKEEVSLPLPKANPVPFYSLLDFANSVMLCCSFLSPLLFFFFLLFQGIKTWIPLSNQNKSHSMDPMFLTRFRVFCLLPFKAQLP